MAVNFKWHDTLFFPLISLRQFFFIIARKLKVKIEIKKKNRLTTVNRAQSEMGSHRLRSRYVGVLIDLQKRERKRTWISYSTASVENSRESRQANAHHIVPSPIGFLCQNIDQNNCPSNFQNKPRSPVWETPKNCLKISKKKSNSYLWMAVTEFDLKLKEPTVLFSGCPV